MIKHGAYEISQFIFKKTIENEDLYYLLLIEQIKTNVLVLINNIHDTF